MRNTSCILFFTAAILMAAAPQALAEKGGKGRGHGQENKQEHANQHHNNGNDDIGLIRISTSERQIISSFIGDDFRRHCPPGLAKKNNGCLPPGQAKKYVVGSVLPSDVIVLPLPDGLLKLLNPTPRGYQYVQVDKDVLLISEAGKKVIDAVTLLSAVGE